MKKTKKDGFFLKTKDDISKRRRFLKGGEGGVPAWVLRWGHPLATWG